MSNSVLQDWVMGLGLRHQGVLLTAVRGCDTAPKQDPSKDLARALRGLFLNCHCGDPARAKTFIEAVPGEELTRRFEAFRKNCDHYPLHYVMHVLHTIQIIGHYHPNLAMRALTQGFYQKFCKALHLNPETKEQLDARLNADEETFAKLDRMCELDKIDRPEPGLKCLIN
jgi:hypothetical protein